MTSDQTQPTTAERYRVSSDAVAPDGNLLAEDGWIDMEVRWLITADSVGARQTVVGRTVLQPGSKHDIHRHPHAEEWEYVVSGTAVKHVGPDSVRLKAGDVVFVPANVFHGLENASTTEPVVTIWGYSGAATLDAAGYELPSEEHA
ncbi:MAG: cupin domain-containing protein [Nocardioides sp.]|uniref:cupin domain-containing protein n=1 Tax=Nocardioides sp. TaxID=35761 RepID=UPI0039E55882